jgi:LysR family transcriptional regulator, flagellar master operon regulator
MNIELARTFLEVISCGSFARAAEQLNVTHSTVTMRIKALEDTFQARLLVRNRSGVTLTAAGRRFFPLAESLSRTWRLTRRQMSLRSGYDGLLSIGAPTLLWDDIMYEWTAKTRRERPEYAIRCQSGSSEMMIEGLFQGWLDLCLTFEGRSRPGFVTEFLFDDPLVIVSTEDRQALDFDPNFIEVQWEEGIKNQELRHWPETAETPHLSTPDLSLSLRFLMEFGGSVLMPERLLHTREFERPLYRVPEQPILAQKVYIMYSDDALSQRLKRLGIDDLRASLLNQLAQRETIWPPRSERKRQMKKVSG